MLSAMAAFSGGPGTLTTPRVASARLALCPRVKAVIVLKRSHRPATRSINPRTKSR